MTTGVTLAVDTLESHGVALSIDRRPPTYKVLIDFSQFTHEQVRVLIEETFPSITNTPLAAGAPPQFMGIHLKYPKSYRLLTRDIDEPFDQAIALLTDYTKNNSTITRFFHGHWNRHHVAEVTEILNKIENGTIDTVDAIIENLEAIDASESGSLYRRLQFIIDNIKPPDDDDDDDLSAGYTSI